MKRLVTILLGVLVLCAPTISFGDLCGDANGDGYINLLDIFFLKNYCYGTPPGPSPAPWDDGDVNNDGTINLLDIIYLAEYKYGNPPGPDPQCSGTPPVNEYNPNVYIDVGFTSLGINPDVVVKGDNFTIDIYMQNESGSDIYGYSCSWEIYSPTDNNMTYEDLGGETYLVPPMILPFNGWRYSSSPGEHYWSIMDYYVLFNMDGALPDTFSHVAVGLPTVGTWPATDNERSLRFQIGMNSDQAGTICIDSISYAPNSNYDWLWAIYSDPEWIGGAYCVNIYDSLLCGDANADNRINLLDILYLIEYKYDSPPGNPPTPMDAGDVNNDGNINLLDILYLIEFLYEIPPGPEPHCI